MKNSWCLDISEVSLWRASYTVCIAWWYNISQTLTDKTNILLNNLLTPATVQYGSTHALHITLGWDLPYLSLIPQNFSIVNSGTMIESFNPGTEKYISTFILISMLQSVVFSMGND